jgi:hypothetical protein
MDRATAMSFTRILFDLAASSCCPSMKESSRKVDPIRHEGWETRTGRKLKVHDVKKDTIWSVGKARQAVGWWRTRDSRLIEGVSCWLYHSSSSHVIVSRKSSSSLKSQFEIDQWHHHGLPTSLFLVWRRCHHLTTYEREKSIFRRHSRSEKNTVLLLHSLYYLLY